MQTVEEAAAIAESFPGVTIGTHYGNRTWLVGGKGWAWERPFSKADLKRFGDVSPPAGPILAVAVADLNDKQAALAMDRAVFDIEHFRNYPAVLVQLDLVTAPTLRTLLEDGWLARAPKKLAEAYLQSLGPR